ncbi:hypothetical protein [Clavibacter michiganensis]|uniref:hypothetical protein n=1 Tax=Clavibacter michiganensis TaxID=28447 RepID=UPI0005BC2113|nr:hypothetical protein [Clavibacter michiganensis]
MTDERGPLDPDATPGASWDDDRGDVPGWVLITLMTAGLVIILWGVAGPLLQNVFTQAIDRVTSF